MNSLCAMALLSLPFASVVHAVEGDFAPQSYQCWYDYWQDKKSLDVKLNDGRYKITFKGTDHPGELKDFLSPLGIDSRIINNYWTWEILSEVSAQDCETKTFASKYPEQLSCVSDGVDFKIIASYWVGERRFQDTYDFPEAKVSLKTQAVRYAAYSGADMENGLRFTFKYEFIGENGRRAAVNSVNTYPTRRYASTDADDRHAAECFVTAMDELFVVGLERIISARQ